MQHCDEKGGIQESSASAVDQRTDLQRRRFVRGAAVAVPTIITLRSGGAAAVSLCPPIKGKAAVDNAGVITTVQSGSVAADDVCTAPVDCPKAGDLIGDVVPVGGGSTNLKCTNVTASRNVFIVSESSAVSLL